MAVETPESKEEEKGVLGRIRSEFGFIRGNFLLIIIGWLLIDFTQEMAFTYYPYYVEALGGTPAIVGLIGALSSIISAVIKFPGGYLADKYGRKSIITKMTFMAAFSYLLYMFAPNWQTIIVATVFSQICFIYTPAFDAMVMDTLPADRRGTGYSIINLITSASTTPSPLIAGMLYANYGLVSGTRISFGFVIVAFLIAGLLRSRLKETVEAPEKMSVKGLLSSFSGARMFVEGIRTWGEVPRTALALMITFVFFQLPNSMFNVIFAFYLRDELAISYSDLAVLGAVISVSVIVLSYPCGKIIDKIGKKIPLMASFLLILLVMPFLIWGDFVKLLLLTPIIALVNILIGTASQALTADLIPPEHRGKISGSRAFFVLISASIGQILGGLIYENVSHQLPLYIMWASTIPAFLLILFFVKEPKEVVGIEEGVLIGS